MKKKQLILIFIILFLLFFTRNLSISIGNMDELWNFNFARNIADGLIPYNDFNMIIPPFIYYLPALFMKIFGTELIIMKIFMSLLFTSISIVTYLLLKELFKDKTKVLITTITLSVYLLILQVYDYNIFSVFVALIALLLEVKLYKHKGFFTTDFKSNFILGLIIGATIMVKHTIGLLIVLGALGFKLLAVRNKDEFKSYLKILGIRMLGVLVPIGVFFGYLIINNNLESFLDYVILAIPTFTNSTPYYSMYIDYLFPINIFLILICTIVPISIVINIVKSLKRRGRNKENDLNLIMFAYAIPTFAIIYPLAEIWHFISASYISIIILIYNLNNYIKKHPIDKITLNKASVIALQRITLTITIIVILFNIAIYIGSDKSDLENLKYIIYPLEKQETLKTTTDYIIEKENEGYQVYILSGSAALYMIPLDRYNKDYDMFNIGNLGSDGESAEIEKIKQANNTIYLILEDSGQIKQYYSQNPMQVREYIVENLIKIDKINTFDVYLKE